MREGGFNIHHIYPKLVICQVEVECSQSVVRHEQPMSAAAAMSVQHRKRPISMPVTLRKS